MSFGTTPPFRSEAATLVPERLRPPFLSKASTAVHSLAAYFLITVGYVVIAWTSLTFFTTAQGPAGFWPANGFLLGLAAATGPRRWSVWPCIAFCADLSASVALGFPVYSSVGYAWANALEVGLAAAALARWAPNTLFLSRARATMVLLAIAVMTTMISSVLGTLAFRPLLRQVSPLDAATLWWVGDAVGQLVAAPFVAAWIDAPFAWLRGLGRSGRFELVGLLALAAGAAVLVFTRSDVALFEPIAWAIFPSVLYAAWRFGVRGTTAVSLVITLIAVTLTARGYGPFAAGDAVHAVIGVQGFLSATVASGLLLAVALHERGVAMEELQVHADVFRNMSEGVTIADARGVIVYANAAAETMFASERGALVGMHVRELNAYTPEENDRVVAAMLAAVRHQGIWNGIVRNLRKDGSEFVSDSRVRTMTRAGRSYFLTVQQDITERLRTEEELRRSREELEERVDERTRALSRANEELTKSNTELVRFAYVASHDLKEPLRMISTFLQLLRQQYSDRLDARANEHITFAVEGARRMYALIDDLLAYSRVDHIAAPTEEIDSRKVFDDVLAALHPLVKESGAEVRVGALPVLPVYRTHLAQLFQNLLSNAIKYRCTSRPLVVEVWTEQRGGQHAVYIRDNGIGIAMEHRTKIFELFQRLHGRDAYPGTGIGLAICKKIVEWHGGRIWVDGSPGEGTVFGFTLPQCVKHRENEQSVPVA